MGWWKTAKPGDKVVCINSDGWVESPHSPEYAPMPESMPVVGQVYAVEYIIPPTTSRVYVKLAGIRAGFNVHRFRPVERDRTSAEVEKLKRLLNVSPADIEVNA